MRIPSFITDLQFANISDPAKRDDGFEKLRLGLAIARVDPKQFTWPPAGEPDRSPYRGLHALDVEDAAVFFGRDGAITLALDEIRLMREGARARMLVLLGASGSGKSSLLRAGLIARLARDQPSFLVLPLIRPGLAAMTGDSGLKASLGKVLQNRSGNLDPLDHRGIAAALAQAAAAARDRLQAATRLSDDEPVRRPPTIVLPVDQLEEFLSGAPDESTQALGLIGALMSSEADVVVVATVRSDAYSELQLDDQFAALPRTLFELQPLSIASYRLVIEGPASLARPPLEVAPEVTDKILADLQKEDALPLLAFTLERLYQRGARTRELTLADYADLGGLQGSIMAGVNAAFAAAERDPALPKDRRSLELLAHKTFVPALVRVDDQTGSPRRRIAPASELSAESRSLLAHFVEQRLVVADRGGGAGASATFEVAHEAIFRQWPLLADWVAAARDNIQALQSVVAASADWARAKAEWPALRKKLHRRARDGFDPKNWLVHRGTRLAVAETLLVDRSFRALLGRNGVAYIYACRDENVFAKLIESVAGYATVVALAVTVVTSLAAANLNGSLAQRNSDQLADLSYQALASGNHELAARYALEGLGLGRPPFLHLDTRSERAAATSALLESPLKAIRIEAEVPRLAVSSAGTIVAAAGFVDLYGPDGSVLALPSQERESADAVAISPDGSLLATGRTDGSLQLWKTENSSRHSWRFPNGCAAGRSNPKLNSNERADHLCRICASARPPTFGRRQRPGGGLEPGRLRRPAQPGIIQHLSLPSSFGAAGRPASCGIRGWSPRDLGFGWPPRSFLWRSDR